MSHEVDYLRSAAAQFGTRLDLLRLEQEMADRQNREAVLQQQVTDAELRALRAQINPHFLFNSLNTIANLIATDPPRAEVMTLRLARVLYRTTWRPWQRMARLFRSSTRHKDFLSVYGPLSILLLLALWGIRVWSQAHRADEGRDPRLMHARERRGF